MILIKYTTMWCIIYTIISLEYSGHKTLFWLKHAYKVSFNHVKSIKSVNPVKVITYKKPLQMYKSKWTTPLKLFPHLYNFLHIYILLLKIF